MFRISRMLRTVLPMVLILAAMTVSSPATAQSPIVDSTSSGLFTFSREEGAIRVAAVFTAQDSAVVPTLVRFLDQGGIVLKEVRGDLRENNAVVAELTRNDVAGRGDLLVRVVVLHKLPGVRRPSYPIIVSTQSIRPTGGAGSLAIFWPGGTCGNPQPTGALPARPSRPGQTSQLGESIGTEPTVLPSKPILPGTSVMCLQPAEAAF